MTHNLNLHVFGAKYEGKKISVDFAKKHEDINDGKRHYIFSVDLDNNEKDSKGDKIPNTSIKAKIENKSKSQVKIILDEKPESETFIIKDKTEIYAICPCCTDKIIQECDNCVGIGNCSDNTCTMKNCKIVGHNE